MDEISCPWLVTSTRPHSQIYFCLHLQKFDLAWYHMNLYSMKTVFAKTNKIQIQSSNFSAENKALGELSCTVISSEDREKAVLWFGSRPPCLLCLWLPVNPNANLTAGTISPIPGLCLLTHCDNNLSQLLIRFFGTPVGLWLFTYLMAFYYPPSFKQLTWRSLYRDIYTQFCCLTVLYIHLALETTGDSRPHVQVPQTHRCRHSCAFQVVLIVLQVSGSHWRHRGRGKAVLTSDGSSVSPSLLSVISCFVFCLTAGDFLRAKQRLLQYRLGRTSLVIPLCQTCDGNNEEKGTVFNFYVGA